MPRDSDDMLLIGAGPVGLAMARALQAHTVPYDHIEADDGLGGNWYHGVYNTAHIISSRKTTEYADYPMPEHYPDFPSAAQMLAYLNDYADHFGLRERLRLNTKVIKVRPVEHDLWEVGFAGGEVRRYRGVVVCNGHHWDRRWPDYPGTFKGDYLHSKDYRGPAELAGKRVLVIGGGNSACDIAAEAARVARASHISLRRGYWFLPKTMFGRPTVEILKPWMPLAFQRLLLRALLAVAVGDYRRYGLPRPDHRIFEHHPTINSELLYYIKQGRIQPHPDVARFEGRRVHFGDGQPIEVDTVVCATGFHVSFPFLPKGLVPVEGPVARLYGGTLDTHKGLWIIGTNQLRYGFGPLVTPSADLHARMIKAQENLAYPVGALLKAMGAKPPRTHLSDPFAALRGIRLALRHVLPRLADLDRRLVRQHGPFGNAPWPEEGAHAPPERELQVY